MFHFATILIHCKLTICDFSKGFVKVFVIPFLNYLMLVCLTIKNLKTNKNENKQFINNRINNYSVFWQL
jgi:hypothetical protein